MFFVISQLCDSQIKAGKREKLSSQTRVGRCESACFDPSVVVPFNSDRKLKKKLLSELNVKMISEHL